MNVKEYENSLKNFVDSESHM